MRIHKATLRVSTPPPGTDINDLARLLLSLIMEDLAAVESGLRTTPEFTRRIAITAQITRAAIAHIGMANNPDYAQIPDPLWDWFTNTLTRLDDLIEHTLDPQTQQPS